MVLGNQLFPFAHVTPFRDARFFMAEDVGLCTYVRHHQQKIVLFLAAMRSYRDELREHGCDVQYHELDDEEDYLDRLGRHLDEVEADRLVTWEVEDKFFEQKLRDFADDRGLDLEFVESPMFLTPRPVFAEWLDDHRPFMAEFYKFQRRRLGVLLHEDGTPRGGRWSFDDENREPLPASISVPATRPASATDHVTDLIPVVRDRFGDHPGALSASDWWLPTTRRQALWWLRRFLDERFPRFGPYEDALSTEHSVLFHSVLSPALNLGLITPAEVLDRALEHADEHDVPLNSLEGFVRQLAGWREFVRGIYRHYSSRQESANAFDHRRRLTDAWYEGTTGIPPLDGVIRKAQRLGWAHHIERLMVAGNLMTLCEIEPAEAHRWFMEMFVDSADWVMGPNVYGMALHADGGIFATKPYICGSNYLMKMGDYDKPPRGAEGADHWHDVVDGLYWRFVDRNREFLTGNARMAQMVATYDRMKAERRTRILDAAAAFLDRVTA